MLIYLVSGERGISTFRITQLADKLQLDIAYVTKILHLVTLAPELQEAIISGRKPDGLSLNRLRRGIPLEREKQIEVF